LERGGLGSQAVRSLPLTQPPTYSDRYPTGEQIRQWVKDPIAYRFEYTDGLKATMLLMNGLVQDFTFAARLIAARTSQLPSWFASPSHVL
jgi:hypothetical protein